MVNLTVLLTEEPLSLDAAFRAVLDPACGGTALFVGRTRSPNQGREADELRYEALPVWPVRRGRGPAASRRTATASAPSTWPTGPGWSDRARRAWSWPPRRPTGPR